MKVSPLRIAAVVGLLVWFIGWLPGVVWLVNACLGGRISWLLIEALFLLLYSVYGTIELVDVLIARGETTQTGPLGEKDETPTLVIAGAPSTVKEAFARARQAGAVREV